MWIRIRIRIRNTDDFISLQELKSNYFFSNWGIKICVCTVCLYLLIAPAWGGGGGPGCEGLPTGQYGVNEVGVWLLNRPETRVSGLNVCAATLSNTDSN